MPTKGDQRDRSVAAAALSRGSVRGAFDRLLKSLAPVGDRYRILSIEGRGHLPSERLGALLTTVFFDGCAGPASEVD